jgi:hypothetical protein
MAAKAGKSRQALRNIAVIGARAYLATQTITPERKLILALSRTGAGTYPHHSFSKSV